MGEDSREGRGLGVSGGSGGYKYWPWSQEAICLTNVWLDQTGRVDT